MNYFELINAILTQLDMPNIDSFTDAKLPVHDKIKSYINRVNFEIIAYDDWVFATNYITTINDKKTQNFVLDEYQNSKYYFDCETDRTIIPEPYGSEMIVYGVCLEICQDVSNPKYTYWKQKYNKAYSELRVFEQTSDGKPVFKIKRG